MNKNDKIFVAGHNGMVGKSFVRQLKKQGFKKIFTVDKNKINLKNQNKVSRYIKE